MSSSRSTVGPPPSSTATASSWTAPAKPSARSGAERPRREGRGGRPAAPAPAWSGRRCVRLLRRSRIRRARSCSSHSQATSSSRCGGPHRSSRQASGKRSTKARTRARLSAPVCVRPIPSAASSSSQASGSMRLHWPLAPRSAGARSSGRTGATISARASLPSRAQPSSRSATITSSGARPSSSASGRRRNSATSVACRRLNPRAPGSTPSPSIQLLQLARHPVAQARLLEAHHRAPGKDVGVGRLQARVDERLAQLLAGRALILLPGPQHRHRLLAGAELRVGLGALAGELKEAAEPLGDFPLHLGRREQLAGQLVPEEELQVIAADLQRRVLILTPGDQLEGGLHVPGASRSCSPSRARERATPVGDSSMGTGSVCRNRGGGCVRRYSRESQSRASEFQRPPASERSTGSNR